MDSGETLTEDGESHMISAATTAANEGCQEVQTAGKELSSESVSFKVTYKRTNYDVTFSFEKTVGELKDYLGKLTGVPVVMMKLMYKGAVKDDSKTLRDIRVMNGAKMMIVGSTVTDVMTLAAPLPASDKQKEEESGPTKEPFSKQRPHCLIIDKGKPDDALPARIGKKEALPKVPVSGMLNKLGGKVRLTFKLDVDQLWIGTRERTQKVQMSSIHSVISEPIVGHEEYHIMALQLGPTEQSRFWIYWVPAQYIDAIKDTILGKWQYF
ncbi:ubiquitin domain-containing protein UBFD1-like isoform X2 [Corticium candelabrum]|uniref:ubiquitin domain-containing protein UBFD1-like isoform X2 n=1 Tax=Corticium candelabrum TaxID=121492 RepID=UPI002E35AD35|nr:ubiquitin domain-containing protein UBFD1-like isoform X2 [Corticium candelabrum]